MIDPNAFLIALLDKFPAFDPAWGADQQTAWFAAYTRLLSAGLGQNGAPRPINGDASHAPAPIIRAMEAAVRESPVIDAPTVDVDAEMEAIILKNAERLKQGPVAPVQPLAPAPQNMVPFPKQAEEINTTTMPMSKRGSIYGYSNR